MLSHFHPLYIDKDFETKEECINFLSNEAIKKGLMDETSKKSVFEREEISSTSIGDLTAIPHPIATDTKKSFISILVLSMFGCSKENTTNEAIGDNQKTISQADNLQTSIILHPQPLANSNN